MQGPPPLSSAAPPPMMAGGSGTSNSGVPMSPMQPMAPPLKKVRADAASTSPNVSVGRRAELAMMQKDLTAAVGGGSSTLSSVMGGPPIGGGPPLGSGIGSIVGAPPLGGSSLAYSAATGPPRLGVSGTGPPRGAAASASGISSNYSNSSSSSNPMLNRYSAYGSSGSKATPAASSSSSSSMIPPDSGAPPAIPGRSAAAMRTSDIFPTVPKTAIMGSSSNPVGSSRSSAPLPPISVARRLDDSLAKAQSGSTSINNTNAAPPGVGFVGGGPPSRPKSAPPRRPPPPPPPPTRQPAAEAPDGDRHTVRRPSPLTPAAGPPPMTATASPRIAPLPPMMQRPPSTPAPPSTKATSATEPPKPNPPNKEEPSAEPSLQDEAAAGPPPVGLQTPGPKASKNDSKVGGGGAGGVAFSDATPQMISPGPNYYSPGEPERTSGGGSGADVMTPGPPVNTANAGQTPYPGRTSLNTAHAGQTPYPGKILGGGPPQASSLTDTSNATTTTTYRRDIVRNMYDIADTPMGKIMQPSSPPHSPSTSSTSAALQIHESHEIRMQKELARAAKDKAGALRQVSALEDELRQMKLELAAQKRLGLDNKPQPHSVGFLSPVALGGGSSNFHGMGLRQRHRRIPTPHPKRLYKNGDDSDNYNNDDSDMTFLKNATECCTHEFDHGGWATFIIRRPFGLASEIQFWTATGQSPSHMYEKKVNIRDPTTLEIAAQISLDNSVFFLHGDGMVRHQTLVNGKQKWKDLGNTLESDQPLGNVMYIDSEANEKEYSLDEIFEQALTVRENYCASITTTSLGLQRFRETHLDSSTQPPPMMMMQPGVLSPMAQDDHRNKPEVNDACVGTEELEYKPLPAQQQQQPQDGQQQMHGGATKDASSGQGAPPPMDDGTGDILSSFMGFFLSTIFSCLWITCVKLPCQIFFTVIALVIGILIVGFIGMYLSDDNGAAANGFSFDTYWNPPGIM